jgi:cold shock CspA family protein
MGIVERRKPVYARVQAQVKFYSQQRGYGFCKQPNKQDIFFTQKTLEKAGLTSVTENDVLEFDLVPVPGKGGKAINIRKVC